MVGTANADRLIALHIKPYTWSDTENNALMTATESKTLSPSERVRLEQVEGVVFNVQRYSLHDGPGVRTNVFLKGCPLHCEWCANPESQAGSPQLALHANQCIDCGQFETACPIGWGRKVVGDGRPTKVEVDVMKEVLRDAPFYEDGGGMTLTGGEPTLQPLMAEALLRLAKAENIATAMETCGHTSWSVLKRLQPHSDWVLYDLKHLNNETHREFTGVGNELILSNLRRLAAVNAAVIVRVPLIPGFNATAESVKAIAEFVSKLEGQVRQIDLLPYHMYGRSKYEALGREYGWQDCEPPSENMLAEAVQCIKGYGLRVSVGG
jgi:pyruvate formate lyase activating enzyme